MSKDYKHRLQQAEKQSRKPPVAGWQWLLAGGLVVAFVVFLMSLRGKTAPDVPPAQVESQAQTKSAVPVAHPQDAKKAVAPPGAPAAVQRPAETPPAKAVAPKTPEKAKPVKPRFQFYTVLPEKEVIIPEAEVKARKQEEKQGKAPTVGETYMLQIGSFKTMAEADRLKAQLALLGVESKIETAQIGNVTWNRVKVGPFVSMATADKTRGILRQNNVDSVVQKTISVAPSHP